MGSGVHVLHKNHDLFIVCTGDTDDNGRISATGQFSHEFCDVTFGGVCPWLAEGCLGIDILPILNFSPVGSEVINDVKDGAICIACEYLLHLLEVLGTNARDGDFDLHIEAGDFGTPLDPESILVSFKSKLFVVGCEIINLFVYFILDGKVSAC